MPRVDLPLPKLLEYTGRNPRPQDFDAFWDASLAELDGIDPDVRLEPVDVGASFADAYHMTFAGVGGARIYAKLLKPKAPAKPGPAVLFFHGYTAHSGEWIDKLAYAANGFTVAAMDCRGQGGRSEDKGGVTGNTQRGHIIRGLEDRPEDLLYRNIYLDCAQLARVVMAMPEVDERRVGATGGSQGGGLTLAAAALEPRIARSAPAYPFLCDYQRVLELEMEPGAYEEIRWWFRTFDPMLRRWDEVFTMLGYIDVQHLAPRIRAEVLMATGLSDTVTAPSTQFAAYNRIPGRKDLRVYPDFGHEHLPGWADEVFRFLGELRVG